MGITTAARSVMRRVQRPPPSAASATFSFGCGVQTGTITLSRLPIQGETFSSITGAAVEQADQLAEHARLIGWAVAAVEGVLSSVGDSFSIGRSGSFVTSTPKATIMVAEVLGCANGVGKPPRAAAAESRRQGVSVKAQQSRSPSGAFAERSTAPRPLPSRSAARLLHVPQRRLTRQLMESELVSCYEAEHLPSGRIEFVRTLALDGLRRVVSRQWLDQYRRLASVDQRNVAAVLEVGETDELAYVASELLIGRSLAQAIGEGIHVGEALHYLAQMCMALDAIHREGILHGALDAQDFLFREEDAVVLAGTGVTRRVQVWCA